MAINLDGVATPALLPGQPERRQADARQGRWLYELEQALLLDGAKKHVEEERQGAEERSRNDGPSPARVAPELPGNPQAAAASGSRLPGSGMTAVPSVGNAVAGRERGAGNRGAEPAVPQGETVGKVRAAAAGVAANTIAQPVAQMLLPAALAPQGLAGGIGLAGGLAGAVDGGTERGSAAASPLLKAAAVAALGLTLAPAPAETEAAPVHQESAEDETAPQTAAHQAQLTEDYANRLLHVYHGTDGVQAWVRDVGISTAQAQGLAQAMAGELAGAGARLAALTVNGKKLALSVDEQQDEFMDRAAALASADDFAAQQAINVKGVV